MSDFRTGDTVEFTLDVERHGAPQNPTTLRLEIQPGQGPVRTLTYPSGGIVQDGSVGKFIAEVVLDSTGLWRYRWVGEGLAPGISRGQFPVTSGAL